MLMELSEDKLREIANWCINIASDKAWKAELGEIERLMSIRKASEKKKADQTASLVSKLKKVLKPGMWIKMKGCKDGLGLREFIQWTDHDDLLCWQLYRSSSVKGDIFSRTSYTTVHMPDKVTGIYVDGRAMKIKSFLK